MIEQLAIGCDNLVSWFDPKDALDGSSIDDATGTVTLKDSDGNAVTGANELTVSYTAGPPRRYYATIPSTITLTEGAVYYVEFILTDADEDTIGRRRERYTAVYAN